MFEALKEAIFESLKFLAGVVGDWGFAIIALTILIRVILLPLTIKQTKSMYELQRIQPKIKELQEKYKNDKEKLQEETLKFYTENKVNPFGGCLPLLLQFPILIALFQVLGGTPDKPGLFQAYVQDLPNAAEAVRFWILLPDITKSASAVYSGSGLVTALPYIIFVVLFGLSTLLPQLLQPGAQAQQRQMSYVMGAMMLFFGWQVSGGVLIYWVTQGLIGIAQQQIQTRVYKAREEHA